MAEHILSRAKVTAFCLMISGALAACGDKPANTDEKMDTGRQPDVAPSQTYAVTGLVTSVTPDRDFLMIRHDTIEGFMDAMTMPFAVRDTAVVSGIMSGDSVGFEIVVSDGEAYITLIEKR